jgi:hypothetical protein
MSSSYFSNICGRAVQVAPDTYSMCGFSNGHEGDCEPLTVGKQTTSEGRGMNLRARVRGLEDQVDALWKVIDPGEDWKLQGYAPITREKEKFEQVISGRDPGEEDIRFATGGEDADPETWPYTFLKDFINSHALSTTMERKALQALDQLVEQHRQQTLDLLSMIIELGTSKDEVIREYAKHVEELEKELSDEQQMLISCKADLHDQQKHELGSQCAELQDQLEIVKHLNKEQAKMIDYLASIAATYTFSGKDISHGEESELLKEYAREWAETNESQ